MTKSSTDGATILQNAKAKVKQDQKEENKLIHQERNQRLKDIGLTLLCVFVIEGAFALGWIIKG